MANRNTRRDRPRGDRQTDWERTTYFEYRYTPYSPYRRNDYYAPNYYDNNMYFGRNYDYNRNEFDRNLDYYGRESEGQYSGYGPSGYTRSDERIREDINERLTWDGRIDATDVTVDVSEGVVTLTGSVDGRQDKRVAEDIADDVPGVWDVNNQLRVRNRGYYRGWQGTAARREMRAGMEVVDSQGNRVGEVKEVHANDFLLGRPKANDIYVPFSACQVSGEQVRLNIRGSQIDTQGWEMPEAGSSGSQGQD